MIWGHSLGNRDLTEVGVGSLDPIPNDLGLTPSLTFCVFMGLGVPSL